MDVEILKQDKKPKTKYYAVAKGRNIGIFTSWDECKANVDKYSGAIYKSFEKENDAIDYLKKNNVYIGKNNKMIVKDVKQCVLCSKPYNHTRSNGKRKKSGIRKISRESCLLHMREKIFLQKQWK